MKKLGETWTSLPEVQKEPYMLQAKKVNLENQIIAANKRRAFQEER